MADGGSVIASQAAVSLFDRGPAGVGPPAGPGHRHGRLAVAGHTLRWQMRALVTASRVRRQLLSDRLIRARAGTLTAWIASTSLQL